jgi:ribosomal peptide maturation radical SAM protein 1
MYRITLINMPFASAHRPSLALTQLKAVVEQRFRDQVSVEVIYLNQEFAHYMGIELYQEIAEGNHYSFGLGDWFFRQVAFPELPDNIREYFLRYYPQQNEQTQSLKQTIQEKRLRLDHYLDELFTKYRLEQADIVGFTSMFSQNAACFALARKIKERNPATITVIGGANCETPMGQQIIKHIPSLDFVFSGPSLISFTELVQHCLSQHIEQCHTIDGIFSRINIQHKRPNVAFGMSLAPKDVAKSKDIGGEMPLDTQIDLNYEPFLNTFEQNFPDQELEPVLLFETSRGCWWGERAHCTFCGLNGLTLNYRAMNSQIAIEQISSLFKYSDRCPTLECVDNILPKQYLKEVLPVLAPPPQVSLFYEVKASLSEEDVQILSKAHVNSIQPGIESLATSTLQLMKKGTTAFQNILLLKYCLLSDVYPLWNVLVGFPGEDEEVYRKYLRVFPLLTHLPPPSGVFPVRFDRYSPYFAQKEHYGLDLHPYDFYKLTYPFDKEALVDFAYYFMDYNVRADYNMKMVRWIGKVRGVFNRWHNFWYESEQGYRPQLFFKKKEHATVVIDSRSGEVLEHAISDMERQVLQQLNKPCKVSDLAIKLEPLQRESLEKVMLSLQDRGLVFSEGEKFLSLVLPHEIPVMPSFIQLKRKRNLHKRNMLKK